MNGLWGYVDTNGIVAIDLTYQSAGSFFGGRAFVGTSSGVSCIDTEGNVLFTLDCERAFPYSDGLAKFQKDGLYGFVDPEGAIVVEPVWEDAGYASEGFISVSDGAAYGYIDYKGSVFITPQYEVAAEFSDGAAYVQRERGRYAHQHGRDVIFENVYSGLVEGLAITRDENGWGFVDALGKIAVACEWEDVDLPSEGLIGVRSSGKWGFINKDGETEIDFTWDYVWPFSNGLAMVATTTDGYAIDKMGSSIPWASRSSRVRMTAQNRFPMGEQRSAAMGFGVMSTCLGRRLCRAPMPMRRTSTTISRRSVITAFYDHRREGQYTSRFIARTKRP